ncbi:MAG: TerB family tellurite resistance protein [Alphaproteobacteria bacterium]
MLRRVGALLGLDSGPQASERDDARLAAAALLIEASLADGAEQAVETAVIERLVRDRFGLAHADAEALVARGRAAADLVRHTRALKRALEPEERVEVLVALWQVALADGALDGFEEALVRRVAGLLYVTDGERARARRLAVERLGGTRA